MNKEIRIVMTSDSALSDGVVGADQINELLNSLNEPNDFKITHIIESLNAKYRINIAVLDLEAQKSCSGEYDNKTYPATTNLSSGITGPTKNYVR